MDLSKAFDALPHGLMIAKLRAYGISESTCKFISSYLSSRQQRVKVGGDKGEWQYLKCRVPQGPVLGPLLFNIFQNDLLYFLVSQCIIYNYNDSTWSKNDKDVKVLEYNLSSASQIAIKWFKDNFIKANAPKFKVAFFSRDKEIKGITINVEGVQLHSNECTKLLGIHVDRYFTFNHHVSELCRQAAGQVNCLMRLFTMLHVEYKLTIFNAFIVSNFLYCPIVWHIYSQSDTTNVEKVQDRALCFIYRKFESDYKSLLNLAECSSLYMDG